MAIERWEMEMRQKGNKAGAEVARVLREQYGDISLPVSETEMAQTRGFTSEQLRRLQKEGYVILEFTGQSIKSFREQGRKFWSAWHKDYPEFESLTSMESQVAINPNELFLPDSNRKTLDKQQSMIQDFSKKIGRKISGVKAVMGEAADYVELAFSYFDRTGEYLFGEKYNYDYARTKTPVVGSGVADVGSFLRDGGLRVSGWLRVGGGGRVWAVPLVVPVETG